MTAHFGLPVDYGVGAGPYFVAAGRFTSGGWTDIVLANACAERDFDPGGERRWHIPATGRLQRACLAHGLAICDFNGDGNNDLAVADRYGVSLLMNTTR